MVSAQQQSNLLAKERRNTRSFCSHVFTRQSIFHTGAIKYILHRQEGLYQQELEDERFFICIICTLQTELTGNNDYEVRKKPEVQQLFNLCGNCMRQAYQISIDSFLKLHDELKPQLDFSTSKHRTASCI